MTQYIDKSAVVAKIERIRNQEVQWMDRQGYTDYHQGLREGYANILSFIDTLEAKEVEEEPVSENLEEASRNYADNEEYGDDVYFAIKAAFEVGSKWKEQQMMAKACEYFRTKKKCVFSCIGEDVYHSLLNEEEIEDFKKYMEE